MAVYFTKGTISEMSEIKSGETRNGSTWSRMTITLDVPGYQGAITKQIFSVSGDNRIDQVTLHGVGDKVEVGWVIYVREYKGNWYNHVDLVSIKKDAPEETAEAPAPERPTPRAATRVARQTAPAPQPAEDPNDDLPF